MTYMIMLVVADHEQLDAVLKAWNDLPAGGLTVVESTCVRLRSDEHPHVPMRFIFGAPVPAREQCSVTLWGVVPDEATVTRCIAEAQAALASLEPAQGRMLAAWPLSHMADLAQPSRAGGQG